LERTDPPPAGARGLGNVKAAEKGPTSYGKRVARGRYIAARTRAWQHPAGSGTQWEAAKTEGNVPHKSLVLKPCTLYNFGYGTYQDTKQQKDGPRYDVKFVANGKDCTKTFRVFEDAKNYKKRIEGEEQAGLVIDPKGGERLFGPDDVVPKFVELRRWSPA
jgi:hypothetical protein